MLPDLYTVFVGVTTFTLLVVASWCVGEGGEILGKKYDASIVGGLVIAWLNTAPETIFFITALESDNPRFAVGAVSGSSIGTAVPFCFYIQLPFLVWELFFQILRYPTFASRVHYCPGCLLVDWCASP
jgi:Ca2+/Na+ antiporter